MKICPKCEAAKLESEFYTRAGGRLQSWCIACTKQLRVERNPEIAAYQRRRRARYRQEDKQREKDYQLRWKFGMSLAEYEAKLESQRFCCAICGTRCDSEIGTHQGKQLAVDHNAKTGQIRGLLCNNCNNGLGRFRESPGLLQAAAMYLEMWQARAKATEESVEAKLNSLLSVAG